MKPENPIPYAESQKFRSTIDSLIRRHNLLCRIEEVFCENDIANEYFENARIKVLDSGRNINLESIFSIAITNMASDIETLRKNDDENYLESKIRELQSENVKLFTKLENIEKALNITEV